MLSINTRDPRPMYEQVRDGIRTLILSGAMAPDEKLPSVRELASSLAINPNTIQRAYRELESMGIIYTVAGKGAFVTPGDAALASRCRELLAAFRQAAQNLVELGVTCDELYEQLDLVIGHAGEGAHHGSETKGEGRQ